MQYIDLRSDTVTQPSPEMREAMATAPVGDDVYGEDPTINELQEEAARRFGKEAGLFVSSGTMGNLCSVLAHCGRSDEMILAKQSHIFQYEVGSAAAYGGINPNTLDVQHDGTLDLTAIRRSIRPDNVHTPVTRLICLENTQAGAYGAPLPLSYIEQVAQIAHENDMKLHIDGARIFNAAAALNMPVDQLCKDADSVTFCLSKGLSAPVGSVIVGSHEFIKKAHKIRKSFGGGMRQAGILAAAGLVALQTMPQRLKEDHANARALAEGLATIPYIEIDLSTVRTNMIFFRLTEEAPFTLDGLAERLKDDYGILARPYYPAERKFRMVTHCWFTAEHVQIVLNAMRTLLTVPSAYGLASD